MPLPCAAKHLCGMSSVPIERAQHHCANCDEPMHGGMCGHLLSELPDDVDIDPDRLSDRGKGLITSPSALICKFCTERLNKYRPDPPVVVAVALAAPHGTTTSIQPPATATPIPAQPKPTKRQPIAQHRQKSSKKLKKSRTELTIHQKLAVLDEINLGGATQNVICKKWGISKQSVIKWKKKREQLQLEADAKGKGKTMRLRTNDGLKRIKDGLDYFYDLNDEMPKDLKIPITSK